MTQGLRAAIIQAIGQETGLPCDGKEPVNLTHVQLLKVRDFLVQEIKQGRVSWPQTKAKANVPIAELPSRIRKTIQDTLNRASALNGGKKDVRANEPKRILNDPLTNTLREFLKALPPDEWRGKLEAEKLIKERQAELLRLSDATFQQFKRDFNKLVDSYVENLKKP